MTVHLESLLEVQKTGAEEAFNASNRFVLYEDLDGRVYDVELPLTSAVDPDKLREELELPSYIDLDYYPMRSAIVMLWAAVNASRLHELYPIAFEKKLSKSHIPALLFGGGAVKIHCKSANKGGPLARDVKDTDFIVPKKQSSEFYRLLLKIDKAFGTRYKSFATVNDRRFNAWRHGERYRITTFNGITDEGTPTMTVLDIFCDCINLRHKLEVSNEFEKFRENLYTIGLEMLLLSKAQFILDAPKETAEELKQCGQDYRILDYPHYAKDKILLGMEEKDVKDVCAVFLDHEIGNGAEFINPQKMRKILERDKKLALTVSLNLRNIAEKPEMLLQWLSKSQVAEVTERMRLLLKELPVVEKKWNKPWWDTAVETPQIC